MPLLIILNIFFPEKFRVKTQGFQKEKTEKQKTSRSNSNASITSKQKKKFIKNIRPETFKRPSSYSCSEAEAITAKKDPVKDCMLVGYRKLEQTTSVNTSLTPASSRQSIVLGTFSPGPNGPEVVDEDGKVRGHAPLSNASSMPSLFVRSCWSRTSITSLPDFSDDKSGSPHTHRRSVKSAFIKSHHIHSDSEVCVRKQKDFHNSESSISKNGSYEENESIGGVSGLSRTNCDDKISQGDIICDINSASGGVDSANGASLKTSCDTLANDITNALNNKEDWYVKSDVKGNDDESDDGTCVANGYDEILEKNDTEVEVNGKNPKSVVNSTINRLTKECANGSTPSLSKDSGIITQDSDDSEHEDKMTVAEFLRDEYLRLKNSSESTQSSTDTCKSDQSLVDQALINQHKFSSDSNIVKSLESSTSSNQNLSSETKGFHPSKSYPELLSHLHNESPRLVSQIGHATLR